jgi:uncharacterized protein YraI
MCKIKLSFFIGVLLVVMTVGCQPLIIPVTPSAETAPAAIPGAATPAETTAMTSTVAVAAAVGISATVAVSETGAAPDTASTEPTLTVLVASLRIRSGPGADYSVLGAATQGEQYPIRGQAYGCQWVQVAHPQLAEAWLSGDAQYVAMDASCDQIAAAAIPTPPTPAPTPPAVPTATPALAPEQQASNPTPVPTEPPAQPADDPFPADQGCLLLQNQLGPELTFTFTSADGSWSDVVKVGSDQDLPYCLAPGRYRVTIDAPPPWSSLNRDFEIKAGERAYFPIRPQ